MDNFLREFQVEGKVGTICAVRGGLSCFSYYHLRELSIPFIYSSRININSTRSAIRLEPSNFNLESLASCNKNSLNINVEVPLPLNLPDIFLEIVLNKVLRRERINYLREVGKSCSDGIYTVKYKITILTGSLSPWSYDFLVGESAQQIFEFRPKINILTGN